MISYGIVLIGGAILLGCTSSSKGSLISHWARTALQLSGFIGILWSLLNFILRFQPQLLHGTILFLAKKIEIGLGGAFTGLILFLFLSGGFSSSYKNSK